MQVSHDMLYVAGTSVVQDRPAKVSYHDAGGGYQHREY